MEVSTVVYHLDTAFLLGRAVLLYVNRQSLTQNIDFIFACRKKTWLTSATDESLSSHGSNSTLHGRRLETSVDTVSTSPAHSIKIDQTLDLELDIKFKIDSGKLVFHCHGNKQAQMEQEASVAG